MANLQQNNVCSVKTITQDLLNFTIALLGALVTFCMSASTLFVQWEYTKNRKKLDDTERNRKKQEKTGRNRKKNRKKNKKKKQEEAGGNSKKQ